MFMPGRSVRVLRAKRILNAMRMRNSVAGESRAVAPVNTDSSVRRYYPEQHSTSVISRRNESLRKSGENVSQREEKRRFDTVEIGGKIIAENDPSRILERRKRKIPGRLNVKA